ncbi:hypothetical protein FA13DRAFT_856983 [Coprinellus micaceus]|uniref:Uncharacterized protein n=1 Tax=Coprinellus micaceus TaxID=71717 RepID=A0A4Y7T296_COPMI|nr:hypothetical protein FA13DRAFT_856983 [Coprinellus micaceus]
MIQVVGFEARPVVHEEVLGVAAIHASQREPRVNGRAQNPWSRERGTGGRFETSEARPLEASSEGAY